jgi:uncharacterized protein YpiB (UPF0302 family)
VKICVIRGRRFSSSNPWNVWQKKKPRITHINTNEEEALATDYTDYRRLRVLIRESSCIRFSHLILNTTLNLTIKLHFVQSMRSHNFAALKTKQICPIYLHPSQ